MILVTGGTGFVGHHVVGELADRGERVRVLSRRPLETSLSRARVEGSLADLRDPASVAASLAGVDAVVHLAAEGLQTGDDGSAIEAVNVQGTRGLARAARAAGVSHFLHVSSAGVYGDSGEQSALTEDSPPSPVTVYQRTKLESENAVRDELAGSPTAWCVLRPFGIYGPGRRKSIEFFRQVKRQRVWIYGPTRVTLHPTYVGDVVQAISSALQWMSGGGGAGEVFNIGGERPVEHFSFVRLVGDGLGVHPRRIAAPAWLAPPLGALGRLGLPIPARFSRRAILYAVDTSKARRVLGFAPERLEVGIERTISWARGARLL